MARRAPRRPASAAPRRQSWADAVEDRRTPCPPRCRCLVLVPLRQRPRSTRARRRCGRTSRRSSPAVALEVAARSRRRSTSSSTREAGVMTVTVGGTGLLPGATQWRRCRSRWSPSGSTRWSTGPSTASPTSSPSLVRNVVVLVEDEPPEDEPDDLLGLYDGVALTERGQHWRWQLPDRIFIFRGPLLDMCETRRSWSRRSGSPSCTRSPTTSASTTTACTTSATPEPPAEPERAGRERDARPSRRRTPRRARRPEPVGLHGERGVGREAAAEAGAEQGQRRAPSSASAENRPSRNEPTTLTSERARRGTARRRAAWPSRKRSGAPTAAPSATSRAVTRRRPRGEVALLGGAGPAGHSDGDQAGGEGAEQVAPRRAPVARRPSSARACSEYADRVV